MSNLDPCIDFVQKAVPPCPNCRKHMVVPIVYGQDRDTLIDVARCGAVQLGIHLPIGGRPLWYCHACGTILPASEGLTVQKHAEVLAALRQMAAAFSVIDKTEAKAASYVTMFGPAFSAGFAEVSVSSWDDGSIRVLAHSDAGPTTLPDLDRKMFDDFVQALGRLQPAVPLAHGDQLSSTSVRIASFCGHFEACCLHEQGSYEIRVKPAERFRF